ncbi:FGGY family carbohydrate kinase [Actinomycetota bacterium]
MKEKSKISENPYVVGIDIGTTNIKGALYSTRGEFLEKDSVSYESHTPQNGYHEQDPEDWVRGFNLILEKLLKYPKAKERLRSITLSNQGGTVIPVDKDYRPLGRAMTWLDSRGAELFETDGFLKSKNLKFYKKTGWRLDSHISFGPLYWMKKKKRSEFKKIHKILFVNDYVLKRISGNNVQDPSNASMSLFYNIIKGKWDKEILDYIGLSADNFSEVRKSGEPIGTLSAPIVERLGIKNKVLIINGGHDQYCSSIGVGLFEQDQILLSTGTAWVVFKMLDDPIFDSENFFAIGRNILKDKYGLLYSLPASGGSINWFAKNLMNFKNEERLFAIISANEGKLRTIKNRILFYPYLAGNFDPGYDQITKATFYNIDISNSYLDLIKAIMEGIAFHIKNVFLCLKNKGAETRSIKMVGGGVKNNLWPQIAADILNIEVLVPKKTEEDFAVKGAAILANHGLDPGITIRENYDLFKSGFNIIRPIKENSDFYLDKYMDFNNIYKKLYKTR